MKISALLAGVAGAALLASGAQAADLILPTTPAPIVYNDAVFDFEGFYLGVQGGLVNPNIEGSSGFGLVGIVAGANFAVTDAVLAGAEVQINGYFGDDPLDTTDSNNGFYAYDILAQGKLGFLVTDSVFAYGLAGVGVAKGNSDRTDPYVDNTYWTAGLGLEVAVTDALSIRGEAAYIQNFDSDALDAEYNNAAGKFTVGLLWHFPN